MSERAGLGEVTAFMRHPGLTPSGGFLAVPCRSCLADQGQPCVKGGEAWPERARQPHAERRKAAHLVAWWDDYGRDSA